MNDQRLAIMLLAGVGIGSAFMPWTELPVLGYTLGIDYSGWITVALYLLVFILSLVGKRNKMVSGTQMYALIFFSLLAAGIGIWEIFDLERTFVSVQYGLYLTALVGLVIPITSFIVGKKRKNSGSGKGSEFSYDTEMGKKGAPD